MRKIKIELSENIFQRMSEALALEDNVLSEILKLKLTEAKHKRQLQLIAMKLDPLIKLTEDETEALTRKGATRLGKEQEIHHRH